MLGLKFWACGIFNLAVSHVEFFIKLRDVDLVHRPGMEPEYPALGGWSSGHWTTKESLAGAKARNPTRDKVMEEAWT